MSEQIRVEDPAHLYIHIPFCLKKCRYCDFYSTEHLSLIPEFVRALIREMTLWAGRSLESGNSPEKKRGLNTLYFGGGTPSVLPLESLESILGAVSEIFRISPDTEISFEVNPGTLDQAYLSGLKSLGINRLSMGIQSFDRDKLKLLGRIHTGDEAVAAIEEVRAAGFENLGLDLIYGIPGESDDFWKKEMEKALSFRPEHLSCYMLTLEPLTPLHTRYLKGRFTPMPPRDQVALFYTTSEFLIDSGYHHYEISNFAREKTLVSRHNSAYWQMKPYLGLGPSAHSYTAGPRPVRSWNLPDLGRYISLINENGVLPVQEREMLTRSQQLVEQIMVGLRTEDGIDLNLFDTLSHIPFTERFKKLVQELSDQGLGQIRGSGASFSLTLAGWARLDNIVEEFADHLI